jgi:hypothetical protein
MFSLAGYLAEHFAGDRVKVEKRADEDRVGAAALGSQNGFGAVGRRHDDVLPADGLFSVFSGRVAQVKAFDLSSPDLSSQKGARVNGLQADCFIFAACRDN